MIVYKTFQTTLSNFFVGVKFLYLQLAILGTVIGKVIIACLVTGDVIPCNTFIPSRARALSKYLVVKVGCWMVNEEIMSL